MIDSTMSFNNEPLRFNNEHKQTVKAHQTTVLRNKQHEGQPHAFTVRIATLGSRN